MDTAFFKNFSPKIENNNTTVNLKYSLLHSYWSSPSRIHPYGIIYTSRMQHWKILQQCISLFKSFDLKPTKLKPNFFSKNQQHLTWLSLRKRKALLNWDLNNLMTGFTLAKCKICPETSQTRRCTAENLYNFVTSSDMQQLHTCYISVVFTWRLIVTWVCISFA